MNKIIDIKTISTSNNDTDKSSNCYKFSFNAQVERLLEDGYVPYDQLQVSFSSATKSVTGGENSGHRYLTQQFVKYEDEF
jgi:hypothetical protein